MISEEWINTNVRADVLLACRRIAYYAEARALPFLEFASDPYMVAALVCAARAATRWSSETGKPCGVRMWRISGGSRCRLVPLSMTVFWLPDDDPFCSYGEKHEVPDPSCECGYYALRPEAACAQLWHHTQLQRGVALGVVSLSGRVVEHRYGWRAERIRLREAWAPRIALKNGLLATYPDTLWHPAGDDFPGADVDWADLVRRPPTRWDVNA